MVVFLGFRGDSLLLAGCTLSTGSSQIRLGEGKMVLLNADIHHCHLSSCVHEHGLYWLRKMADCREYHHTLYLLLEVNQHTCLSLILKFLCFQIYALLARPCSYYPVSQCRTVLLVTSHSTPSRKPDVQPSFAHWEGYC